MSDPLRVLIHNDHTSGFEASLRDAWPAAAVETCTTYDGLGAQIEKFRPNVVYTVRFAGTPGFPRDALFGANGPQWVANGGAGTDHFGQWDTARTTVTNAAGVAADMMAEYVIGAFLHFTLDVPGLQADKSLRRWQPRKMQRLQGQTLLIVGLGHTGRAIALRAKAFGMRVIGTRATPRPMEHVDEVHSAADLAELLPHADFIVVSTPLTAGTRNILGHDAFAVMKPGVILADVSRGGVMDQQALFHAMTSNRVAGAALDVFEIEPLSVESPLWGLDNAIISPHCSSVFEGWEGASFDLFLANLARWVAGHALVNVVNSARGY